MKYILAILFATIVVLGISLYFINEKKNAYKSDLNHLNNTIDITIDKRINDAKRIVTDSLLKEFNSREPITETKIKIKYRYDTIIDSVLVMPSGDQLRYITTELDRLYPSN